MAKFLIQVVVSPQESSQLQQRWFNLIGIDRLANLDRPVRAKANAFMSEMIITACDEN